MPELPEAETIARTLAPRVEGRRIVDARFFTARVRGAAMPELAGRTVVAVRRYGKQILLELDEGLLAVRLGMTGLLLWRRSPGPHTRALLRFEAGAVCFDDVRQFGSIQWMAALPEELGPDPLDLPAGEFRRRIQSRRSQVKRLLLDQRFLRGLGNIYADEVLFQASIHPRTLASRLSASRARRLHRAIVDVLTLAIEKRGSSISDYVDAEGRPGRFQQFHQVYGKKGLPCPNCGTGIRRIVAAGRGTHYCPKCQRP